MGGCGQTSVSGVLVLQRPSFTCAWMELTDPGKAKACCYRSENGFVSRRSKRVPGGERMGDLDAAQREGVRGPGPSGRVPQLLRAPGSVGERGKEGILSICIAPRLDRRSLRFGLLVRRQLQESRRREQPNVDGSQAFGRQGSWREGAGGSRFLESLAHPRALSGGSAFRLPQACASATTSRDERGLLFDDPNDESFFVTGG